MKPTNEESPCHLNGIYNLHPKHNIKHQQHTQFSNHLLVVEDDKQEGHLIICGTLSMADI
jgi:hypothetical protein